MTEKYDLTHQSVEDRSSKSKCGTPISQTLTQTI